MKLTAIALIALITTTVQAADDQFEKGKEAITKMQGCYLVDYSYVETESLKEGYTVDRRVYDVNKNKSMKEWIYAEQTGRNKFRIQHILFGVTLDGKLMEGSELRHQAEDWEYNATYLYDFTQPRHWKVKDLRTNPNQWTRRITFLDDGPRYQCASQWNLNTENPEWSCSNSSPIPGRETRDMGRKDYNVLDRFTRIMVYNGSWLERQENTKVIFAADTKTPLAKELGKNWYVRLPDSECEPIQSFVKQRGDFWTLLRETWMEVLNGRKPFTEKLVTDGSSRYMDILTLEEKYIGQDLSNKETRATAKAEILDAIEKYRE